jgi:transposase-like protein
VCGPAPHQDLAERVRQIGHIDTEYAEEFILQALGQLLRAGVPLDAIAQKFGVTVRTISNWKKRYRERLREGAARLDRELLFGETMSFYRSMVEQCLQLSLTAKTSREKLAALAAARAAMGDKLRFLKSIGFWDNFKFGNEQNEERMRRADKLSAEALKVLFGFDPDALEAHNDKADAAED